MPRSSWLEKAVSLSLTRALVLTAPALAACSFGGSAGDGGGDTCHFSYTPLCGLSYNGPRKFTGPSTLNTSTNSVCTKVIAAEATPGAPELCVISAESIDIQADAVIRVVGKRPLVLAAKTFLRVAGSLDASSTRARAAGDPGGAAPEVLGAGAEALPCTDFIRAAVNSTTGGSGGAGGSFVGRGGGGGDGAGGVGGLSNVAVAEASLTFPRGGCRGQRGGTAAGDGDSGTPGDGGPAGGVVYLASQDDIQIVDTGKIGVNGGGGGGGGARTGGGGGGSGGLIVLEALGSIRHTGLLTANGGGGGGGGYFRNTDSTQYSGASGADGSIALARAPAGNGEPGGGSGGNGGNGGALGYDDATLGSQSTMGGGGGGGGGVGWIHFIAPGPIEGNGEASPPME